MNRIHYMVEWNSAWVFAEIALNTLAVTKNERSGQVPLLMLLFPRICHGHCSSGGATTFTAMEGPCTTYWVSS